MFVGSHFIFIAYAYDIFSNWPDHCMKHEYFKSVNHSKIVSECIAFVSCPKPNKYQWNK